jgi:hypothetical protein
MRSTTELRLHSSEGLNNHDNRGSIEGNAYRNRFPLQRLGKYCSDSNGKDLLITIGKSTVRLGVFYSVRQELPREDY